MKPAMFLIFLIFAFAFCNSQSTNGSLATQSEKDSIAQLQKDADKYLDSVTMKVSLKEFKEFLYTNVTGKEYNEMPFVGLYNFFMQQKLNAWLNERAKKQVAKSPPKKN